MENSKKRSQQKEEEMGQLPEKMANLQLEEGSSDKQPKHEGEDQEQSGGEEEHPEKEFLEPHQACEIYSALPAFHQRRLLILCRDIFELGPSPDDWTRWKIFNWAGNKWNPNDCAHGIVVSTDGLSYIRNDRVLHGNALGAAIRATHAAFPPAITTNDPIQVCYFETEYVGWFFSIGFYGADASLYHGWLAPNQTDRFILFFDYDGTCGGYPNRWHIHGRFGFGDVVGCGLLKHSGKRRIFYTRNGEFYASVPIPSNAPDQLFPAITIDNCSGARFTDTNFGMKPFLFKYAGNEEKLLKGLGRWFEKEEGEP